MRLTQEEGGHADICVFPTGENIVLPLGGNTNDRGKKSISMPGMQGVREFRA